MSNTQTPLTDAVWRGSNVQSKLYDLAQRLELDVDRHKAALRIAMRYCPEDIRDQVRAGLARPINGVRT